MDFTITRYKKLLSAFISKGYTFLTVSEYIDSDIQTSTPVILLRHDVEARYENALQLAQIQYASGVKGTYYFRLFSEKKNEHIIRQIAAMGHEIGYHYDDLSHCKGDRQQAIKRFEQHLAWLRQIAPVTSITMEGAPMSKYDNRNLWSKPSKENPLNLTPSVSPSLSPSVSPSLSLPPSPLTSPHSPLPTHYSNFNITSEPYFDLDFDKLFYLTDTARRWDGWNYSRRDKMKQQESWIRKGWKYHTSEDIIQALHNNTFPKQLMMTFHPQRWSVNYLQWVKELVAQRTKNLIKRYLV
jgi:hypothetical protein